MSTVSPNLDHITLDSGDSGIQWIPGVGFRPVDMTEELPFYIQMDCDMVDTGTQCEQGICSSGKGGGKYDVPFIPEFYDPPIMTYAPPYIPPLYSTPYIPWDYPWIPPVYDCCYYTTEYPPSPPPSTPPSTVPIGESGFLMLSAIMLTTIIRRFS